MIMNIIEQSLAQAKSIMEKYLSDPDTVRNIAAASEYMAEAIRNGGKIISCGNGKIHALSSPPPKGPIMNIHLFLPSIGVSHVHER